MQQGLKRLGVKPERFDWYLDPATGAWRLTTSRHVLNASQRVPTKEELARRVAEVLPRRTVGPRLKDVTIIKDDSGWRIQGGVEWRR